MVKDYTKQDSIELQFENVTIFAVMRIVVYILTIYFIGLNFVPCNDVFYTETSGDSIEQFSSIPTQNNQDECTPVCSCHCCQVQVIKNNFTKVEKKQSEIAFSPIELPQLIVWELPQPIFDPPRV